MSNSNESRNAPPGGRFGNSGVVAHKAGIKDWRPGDDIPEHYIVYAVSAEEVCKYCDALKALLDSYVERGILTYEVKRLTKEKRIKLYAERGLSGATACVPQFSLLDRRSEREQPIGGREDAMVWLEHRYVRSAADGIITADTAAD